jgi:endonuclease III
MTEKEHLNIGDLVKVKPLTQSKKYNKSAGVPKFDTTSPFDNDFGIVVQVVLHKNTKHNYVVVLWQKLAKEFSHFPSALEKISSVV